MKASEIIKTSCCATLLDVPKSELVAMVEKLERENERYKSKVCSMCDGNGMIGNILDSVNCPDCEKIINNIKADAITKAANHAYAEGYRRPINYLHDYAKKLRDL